MISLVHHHLKVHLEHTFRLARGASDTRDNLIVELQHEDLIGLGEAAPIARYHQDWRSAAQAAEKIVDGMQDPTVFYDTVARLTPQGQPAAAAAIDMALRDLMGKRLGVPLYELIGVDPGATPPTSFTIGLDEPEVEEPFRLIGHANSQNDTIRSSG